MKINVHAGHNLNDGAVGIIKESTEARKVKNEVIRQLRCLGHTVHDCTVDDGRSVSDNLRKIIKKCNKNKVDLDVSIHFNACVGDYKGNGYTTGTEVWIYNDSSKAIRYADRVSCEIAKLGYRNRGIKTSNRLYVLRKTKSPAMLIECCFVDDRDDVKLYDPNTMADAIVRGIAGKNYKRQEPIKSNVLYKVQVGTFSSKENAEKLQKELSEKGYKSILVKTEK